MITILFIGFVAAATLVTFTRWRLGIPLAIVAGVLEDPVRKLTPGAPVAFVLASVPIWTAVGVGALIREKGAWAAFKAGHRRIARLMTILVISLLLPTVVVFRFGPQGLVIALLGVFGYVSPLAGIVIGHAYARDEKQIHRVVTFYCAVVTVMMAGTVLEYADVWPDWLALGTQALGGIWIRNTGDTTVQLISGFFRSPDIMGWHAAMLVMLSGTLILGRRPGKETAWLLSVVLGIVCLLLGGRRKMIVMPVVWLGAIGLSLLRAGRLGRVVSLASLAALIVGGVYFASGEIDVHENYYVYAGTTSSEGLERLTVSVFGSVWETYKQSGFFGNGIGTATQGVQHLAPGESQVWQESGPSKVLVELGVPGFLCGVLLFIAIARAGAAHVRVLVADRQATMLPLGLLSVILANVASFVISHQAYSDALVMDLTAFLLGVSLAAPRWRRRLAAPPPARDFTYQRPLGQMVAKA